MTRSGRNRRESGPIVDTAGLSERGQAMGEREQNAGKAASANVVRAVCLPPAGKALQGEHIFCTME
jgi:hypothetical protein